MKGIRKTVGICLLAASVFCALSAASVYADPSCPPQGQTDTTTRKPQDPPQVPAWVLALIAIMI